jgi:hypothetical protein
MELEQNYDTVMDVLWARRYTRAKAAYDNKAHMSPEAQAELMSDRMVKLVHETDFALVREAMAARERNRG